MTSEEFYKITEKVKPYTDYIYLHLMGEPLLHPEFEKILEIAKLQGLKVIVTTNGTLLSEKTDILLNGNIFKLNVSLHSSEGNGEALNDTLRYCKEVFEACSKLGDSGVICVMRLWNEKGKDSQNEEIISLMRKRFPLWEDNKSGYKLDKGVYVEYGEKFDWPDLKAEEKGTSFCYALRDHCGILADGRVVPCCLDSDGVITLGNIFNQDLNDILDSERAKKLFDGFTKREACEELCQRCEYASKLRKTLDV